MKTWMRYTITILLTLVALVTVAGAGYHLGLKQGVLAGQRTNHRPPEFGRPGDVSKDFNHMGPNSSNWGFGHDGYGFRHEHGGMRFFFPLFGLLRLAVLGLLLWLGYTLYKKSGWQFVRTTSPPASKIANEEKKTGRKPKS